MAEPRTGHTATLLQDGRVLVAGGIEVVAVSESEFNRASRNSVEIFDPATGTWSAGPSMHDARFDHVAIALPDARVFVIGGTFAAEDSDIAEAVISAEIYDPATNAWAIVDNVPDRTAWTSATLLPDGRVFLIGWTEKAFPHEQQAAIYDPGSDTWSAVATTDLVRGRHRTQLLANGTVLVAGGLDPRGDEASPRNDAATYDPKTNHWTDVGPMGAAGWDLPLALLPDGRALVLSDPNVVYDPTAHVWTPSDGPGGSSAVVTLLDGRVLAFPNGEGVATAGDLSIYNPSTSSWSSAGRYIQISGMTLTRLTDGRVLSAGGYLGCFHDNPCATGEIASAWVFDPAGLP